MLSLLFNFFQEWCMKYVLFLFSNIFKCFKRILRDLFMNFSPYGITKLFLSDVFREIGNNLLFSKIEENNWFVENFDVKYNLKYYKKKCE